MATAAQLRARRAFVKKYGHRKKHRNPLVRGRNLTPSQRAQVLAAFVHRHHAIGQGRVYRDEQEWIRSKAFHFTKKGRLAFRRHAEPDVYGGNPRRRHHNPEGEGRRRSILPWVLGGAAVLLLMRGSAGGGTLLGGILGGAPTGTYTQVGTDANGRPIYSGPVGGVTPTGYTQTGTTAAGNPVYSYGGTGASGLLSMAPGIVTGLSSFVSSIGRMFTGGASTAADIGSSVDVSGFGDFVSAPSFALPDLGLPNLTLGLPTDIGVPDLTLPSFDPGAVDLAGLGDWQMPQLDLGLGTSLGEAVANLQGPNLDIGWF